MLQHELAGSHEKVWEEHWSTYQSREVIQSAATHGPQATEEM